MLLICFYLLFHITLSNKHVVDLLIFSCLVAPVFLFQFFYPKHSPVASSGPDRDPGMAAGQGRGLERGLGTRHPCQREGGQGHAGTAPGQGCHCAHSPALGEGGGALVHQENLNITVLI